MRIVAASAAVLALLAGPALSQTASEPTDPLVRQYEREQKERAEVEKRYDATMKHLRTQGPSAPLDPWRNVRPAEPAKTRR
jgi:hypothetical protein